MKAKYIAKWHWKQMKNLQHKTPSHSHLPFFDVTVVNVMVAFGFSPHSLWLGTQCELNVKETWKDIQAESTPDIPLMYTHTRIPRIHTPNEFHAREHLSDSTQTHTLTINTHAQMTHVHTRTIMDGVASKRKTQVPVHRQELFPAVIRILNRHQKEDTLIS